MSIRIITIFLILIIFVSCFSSDNKEKDKLSNNWGGMIELLDETTYNSENYQLILIGEGFQDKVFYIGFFKGKIDEKKEKPDIDKALLYEYVDLKEVRIDKYKTKTTRFVISGNIDMAGNKIYLHFSNGDTEIYNLTLSDNIPSR